jgi:integrase
MRPINRYLTTRGGMYYLARRVPEDVKALHSSVWIREALRTSDLTTARKLRDMRLSALEAHWNAYRVLLKREGTNLPIGHDGRSLPTDGGGAAAMYRLAGGQRTVKRDFHAIRHTFASKLASLSTEEAIIAKLLGHAPLNVTGRYAGKVDTEVFRNVVEGVSYW